MTTEGNVTEAEIASHWKEEELIHPSPGIHRAGQSVRPGSIRPLYAGQVPRLFRRVRQPLVVGQVLAYDP